MEREIKRYRIRPKVYLCLSPEEALSTGISTGEQIVEEIDLVLNPGIGYFMYAAIRNLDETQIRKIPVNERGEKIFESRREAVKYIRENSPDFLLYGVRETKMVPREEISREPEPSSEDFLKELQKFNK